jgi:hypothetical protein
MTFQTKYHGATNTRGSRISATGFGTRVYVEYRCELSSAANHAAAVRKLCQKFGWAGILHRVPLASGYVYAMLDEGLVIDELKAAPHG